MKESEGVFSHKRTPAVDRLLGMKPKVECVENSMTLKLHGAAPLGSSFLIDRGMLNTSSSVAGLKSTVCFIYYVSALSSGNAQPLSLSKVPPDCGYMVRKSWRDLAFSTPYDGCFVTQEVNGVVILLLLLF